MNNLTAQNIGQIHHAIDKCKNILTSKNISISCSDLQKIAMDQIIIPFSHQIFMENLQKRAIQFLNNNQFRSLANKKIKLLNYTQIRSFLESNYIQNDLNTNKGLLQSSKYLKVTVDSQQKYQKILFNHQMLTQASVNVPQILSKNNGSFQIIFQYIQKRFDYTNSQCNLLIETLKNLHNFLPNYQNTMINAKSYYFSQHKEDTQKIKKMLNNPSKPSNLLKSTMTFLFMPHFKVFVQKQIHQHNDKFVVHSDHKYTASQIQFVTSQMKLIAIQLDLISSKKQFITFQHRDFNKTNILIKQYQGKQQLYLIDYDSQSLGLYIIDICFILNDKFHFINDSLRESLKYQFFSQVISEKLKNNLKYEQFQRHFTLCSLFFCFKWLYQMTTFYVDMKVSFHMNLMPLISNLQRNVRKYCKKYIKNVDRAQLLHKITQKTVKGFIQSYKKIQKKQNLNKIPTKLIFMTNQNKQKVQITQGLSSEQLRFKSLINLTIKRLDLDNQLIQEIRKAILLGYLNSQFFFQKQNNQKSMIDLIILLTDSIDIVKGNQVNISCLQQTIKRLTEINEMTYMLFFQQDKFYQYLQKNSDNINKSIVEQTLKQLNQSHIHYFKRFYEQNFNQTDILITHLLNKISLTENFVVIQQKSFQLEKNQYIQDTRQQIYLVVQTQFILVRQYMSSIYDNFTEQNHIQQLNFDAIEKK